MIGFGFLGTDYNPFGRWLGEGGGESVVEETMVVVICDEGFGERE